MRTALEDIQNLRMTKIRNGLQTIARQARNDATTFSVKMNNVGALEILSVRSFLTGARARLYTPAAKRALTRARARAQQPPFPPQLSLIHI